MASYNELIVSAKDAEALASLVGRRGESAFETEAANALADALIDARKVPHELLPGDRVAMNSRVVYREEPAGEPRAVALVHPSRANASGGAISVLSPVGRALLGRRLGSRVSIDVPGGRALTVRLLEVENAHFKEAA
jgi:regulator of nucleoside diphosphate kinase